MWIVCLCRQDGFKMSRGISGFVFPDFYDSFPRLCLNVAGGFQGIKINSCSSSGFSGRENWGRNHKIKYKIHMCDQGSQQWWKAAPADKRIGSGQRELAKTKSWAPLSGNKGAGLAVGKGENEIRKSNGTASAAPLCQGSAGHPSQFLLALSLGIWSYCKTQVMLNCWEICHKMGVLYSTSQIELLQNNSGYKPGPK